MLKNIVSNIILLKYLKYTGFHYYDFLLSEIIFIEYFFKMILNYVIKS